MKSIATLTMNPCIDVSAEIDRVEPTKKLRCRNLRRDPGGGGINVARAVHYLGGEATAVYTCGGITGDMLQQMLDDEEIDNRALPVNVPIRESFAVLEKETGEQYRFVMPGWPLAEEEWRRCLEELKGLEPPPDFLVASGSLPQGVDADFYARLAGGLANTGTKFIVDTSGPPLQAVLDTGVFMIKPNLRELQETAGRSLEDEKELEKYCRNLVDRGGCEIVILTLGHKGALVTDREIQIRLPAMDVKVESAIGAGDSFVAGVVYSLALGKSHEDAFYYGMAAGTAALITPGTELCRRQDTEKYFQQLKERRG